MVTFTRAHWQHYLRRVHAGPGQAPVVSNLDTVPSPAPAMLILAPPPMVVPYRLPAASWTSW
jgi:hypothetical protein